jgi:rare lipoprotein A
MFEVVALMLLSHQPLPPVAVGEASYYTVESSSTITASGERFRDDALTCAMLEGEFGEYFLVVAENGRSVVVRLNDRGPYIDGRVIDLSEAAIRELHPTTGTLDVRVYPLGKDRESAELLSEALVRNEGMLQQDVAA